MSYRSGKLNNAPSKLCCKTSACRGELDREDDIMNMAAAVAADFDFFVCRDPAELREFAPGGCQQL